MRKYKVEPFRSPDKSYIRVEIQHEWDGGTWDRFNLDPMFAEGLVTALTEALRWLYEDEDRVE
jgi:hypothetical protein